MKSVVGILAVLLIVVPGPAADINVSPMFEMKVDPSPAAAPGGPSPSPQPPSPVSEMDVSVGEPGSGNRDNGVASPGVPPPMPSSIPMIDDKPPPAHDAVALFAFSLPQQEYCAMTAGDTLRRIQGVHLLLFLLLLLFVLSVVIVSAVPHVAIRSVSR